ncbi:MAG TPA: chemotaxis protein CheB [Actinomycetota bacterium]|nr:chemotaxis protein CheB [Actinomycetota bacterium]
MARSADQTPHGEPTVCDVIAIAASAGGLAALSAVLSEFKPDLPAALLVVQHMDPQHPSHLAEIMGRRVSLQVKQATQNEKIKPGTVYFAVPNRHLLLNPDGRLSLTDTPAAHFVRPAADLLFESVAKSCGARGMVVILSGSGTDGADGATSVKEAGGTVIVQDEETAEFFSMPRAAIETGSVDHVLPLSDIAAAVVQFLDHLAGASR